MANEFYIGRIKQLHDIEVNWQSVASIFIPMSGEACITDDGVNKGRVKYGDGITSWGNLPYSDDNGYDNSSIVSNNHKAQVSGYQSANNGQTPIKSDGGFNWVTPVSTINLGSVEGETITPTNSGNLIIPVAGVTLGVVKESDEVGIESDGSITIKQVDIGKINYDSSTSVKDVIDDKINSTFTSVDGSSFILNNEDTSGIKYESVDGTTSFVGISPSEDGSVGQLYSVTEDSLGNNVGSKLSVTTEGIFYSNGDFTSEFSSDDEIATKGDIENAKLAWGTFD